MDVFHQPPALEGRFSSSPDFHYTRLADQATYIRLIKIRPSADLTDTIQLDLFHKQLHHVSAYLALSYTWGRPAVNFPADWNDKHYSFKLMVNGCKFSVRPNLFHALLELRRQGPETSFWIDAICIDQSNIPEKNKQVQLMGEIYRRSTAAIVWLGPADESTDIAYIWMARIAESRESSKTRPLVIPENERDWYAEAVRNEFMEKDALEKWQSLTSVLTRTWFERAWVAQEICLAPGALLKCGHRSITWLEVVSVTHAILQHSASLKFLPSRGDEARLLNRLNDAVWALMNLTQLLDLHDIWTSKSKTPPLCHILDKLRLTDCENPRDKVYAGLGLAKEGLGMEVDYSRSVDYVFSGILGYSMEEDETIDMRFLGYCNYPPVMEGVPSWLPDWTQRSKRYEPFPKKATNLFKDPDAEPLYSAGGTLELTTLLA